MPQDSLLKQLILMLPIFAAILIALCLAHLSISAQMPKMSIVPFPEEKGMNAILMNVSSFVAISSLSVLFFYLILKKKWMFILEKMFVLTGGFLTFFFLGMLSIFFFKRFPSFFSFLLIYLGLFFMGLSIAFVIADVFSAKMKNTIFLVYGAVTGSFLGLGVPKFSMIFILISLCMIDVLFIRSSFIKDMVDVPPKNMICVKIRYSTVEYEIGLGDLLYYSMLTSYSLINFGPLTAVFSAFLILMGWALSLISITRSSIFPGLPIPIGMGLIPLIIQLSFQLWV